MIGRADHPLRSMPQSLRSIFLIAITMALCTCEKKVSTFSVAPAPTGPLPVVVSLKGMTRGGQPYFVKGAGGDKRIDQLAARGANSLRTWSTNGLDKILDEAQTHGLTVSAGIWIEYECSWFSYHKPADCDKQAERIRKDVMLHRDHPALLAWGIGNEAEGDGSNVAYWKQMDRIAKMIQEIDPHHPTFTAVAGASAEKVKNLIQHTPHLDFLGINTYGGAFGLRKHLETLGWKRPWLLTEWGPRGFWESKRTPANSPLEPTSSEKAAMIQQVYEKVITPDGGCLGSYVFVWGWKFESTATWFGLYTHEGDTTNSVDVMEEMWTGKKTANRTPSIEPIKGIPVAAVAPGTILPASVKASDPDGDPVTLQWALLPERLGHENNSIPMPKAIEGTIDDPSKPSIAVKAPTKPGVYRLYVWAKDGKGHAATANHPLNVR